MNKQLALLTATVCASAAFAATPLAVWDGANTSLGGFSLTAQNGNTIQNNVITIASSATGGVVYTGPNNSLNNCTFIIRCSGLDLANANNQYLLSLHQNMLGGGNGDASYNKVGVSLAANNAAVRGIWNNGFYNDNGGSLQVADPFSAGTDIVVNIQTSGGVFAYEIVTDANTGARTLVKRFGHTGLKASNTNYKGFSLGGKYEKNLTNLSPATGWTISKMAVFGSTLSEAEILEYAFPSDVDTIAVNANTTVSALNDLIAASSGAKIILSVADGVEIAVDTAFVASVPVKVASSGTITLSANAQPDASYFSAVSFAVQGALLRSWLTPGVVGFNFNANGGRNGQGNTDGAADTALALEIGTWYKDAYAPSGSSTAMFADGLSLLTWKSKNVWSEVASLTSGTFIQGYLDDGSDGNGPLTITLTDVPYETYDLIIYCSTDTSSNGFKAKTVNGTIYKWDDATGTTVVAGGASEKWGLASAAAGKAVYGANTLRINNLTGALTILGGAQENNARGCISAIQIMPAGTSTAPELTIGTAGQTTQATWTGANWNVATAPTSGNVIINVAGDVELTIDEAVALSAITVTGEGKLKIIPDQPNNVTFTASSISSAVPLLFVNDGIGIDTISASVTYLYRTPSVASSIYGNTYMAGVGSQATSVAIGHNGGSAVLDGTAGDTYYLSASDSSTATTVVFTNATATYSNSLGVGAATYIVAGQSVITTGVNTENPQSFVLSQGAAGRGATFMLKDNSVVNVTGTSDVDSNQASIMFGHWNGPSTFIIQDTAAFNATCQVLVGKTANNQSINIDGGTFTAKGIKASASASGTNRLNLNGGLLVLGTSGITSYGSTTIGVNVSTNSEIRASAETLPVSQPVTIASGTVLSFTKASGVPAATVSLTGAVSGSGGISAGPGVTLNVGTNRPEGEISIEADGALAVVMASKVDVPVLKVASNPASVILYDTDGTTVLSGATVEYDAESGTVTIKPPVNTWNVEANLAFDTAANWTFGLPESTQDTAIKVTGDAALTIAGTYEAATLTVSGPGVVEFSGEGSFTVGTLYLNGGATLAPNSKVSAASIVLDSGTVLCLGDKTESAIISGAGAVETYGNITFGGNNTFSGGLTVKSGTARTTTATGFGPNRYGQAIGNLARITVEDGGSLDLNGTVDTCYAITIAGKGVLNNGVYSGVLFNSGAEMGATSRQTASLTLTADAMVKADNGWGLVNSSHAASVLALNGHTLTVSGAGNFPIVTANTASGTATTGTLVVDGAKLGLVHVASNLTGVNVIVKGGSELQAGVAPSAIGSLTFLPTATSGVTATSWHLPASPLPKVSTANIDPTGLSDGQVLTLLTAPSGTTLTSETINVAAGGRFTTDISGNTVTATFHAAIPQPFLHYDFNAANSIAADSLYNFGNLNPAFVRGRDGMAGSFTSSAKPWYDTNTARKSPFYAGEMTAVSALKLNEANNTILWNLGSGWYDGMALIAKDSTTLSVVAWANQGGSGGNGSEVVSVTGIDNLIGKWHFVAIVANGYGTTLYVDGLSASVDTVLPSAIGQQGQFGSIHGTTKNYSALLSDGFDLDDWRIYDAALTPNDVKTLYKRFMPPPIAIFIR